MRATSTPSRRSSGISMITHAIGMTVEYRVVPFAIEPPVASRPKFAPEMKGKEEGQTCPTAPPIRPAQPRGRSRISPAPRLFGRSPGSARLRKRRNSSTHRPAPFGDSSPRVRCQCTAWDDPSGFPRPIFRLFSPPIAAYELLAHESPRGLISHLFSDDREDYG
jgi:hypothetical protein